MARHGASDAARRVARRYEVGCLRRSLEAVRRNLEKSGFFDGCRRATQSLRTLHSIPTD